MELNDDILVQTTRPQTIARVNRVKCQMFYASLSTLKDARESLASFASVCMVCRYDSLA